MDISLIKKIVKKQYPLAKAQCHIESQTWRIKTDEATSYVAGPGNANNAWERMAEFILTQIYN